jgi:hypothetical protein
LAALAAVAAVVASLANVADADPAPLWVRLYGSEVGNDDVKGMAMSAQGDFFFAGAKGTRITEYMNPDHFFVARFDGNFSEKWSTFLSNYTGALGQSPCVDNLPVSHLEATAP